MELMETKVSNSKFVTFDPSFLEGKCYKFAVTDFKSVRHG